MLSLSLYLGVAVEVCSPVAVAAAAQVEDFVRSTPNVHQSINAVCLFVVTGSGSWVVDLKSNPASVYKVREVGCVPDKCPAAAVAATTAVAPLRAGAQLAAAAVVF